MEHARTVQPSALRVGHLFLQAYEFAVWIEQSLELLQFYTSMLVWYGFAAPDYANPRLGFASEPMLPRCYFLFIGGNVARAGYAPDICLERRAEGSSEDIGDQTEEISASRSTICGLASRPRINVCNSLCGANRTLAPPFSKSLM